MSHARYQYFLSQPALSWEGILKPGPQVPDGVPYVRVADFPSGPIRVERVRRTSPQIAEAYRRSVLRSGDLLLSIRGTFGRVAVVPLALEGANITQDTARLSIHPSILPDYVALFLQSPAVQRRLKRAAKGVAVRGVNIGDVRALQVPLPPYREQVEIVRRAGVLLVESSFPEQRMVRARTYTERLPEAILAAAFRGGLSGARS